MADDFRVRNNLSGEVGDSASVVQVHNVHGDVLLLADRKRSAAAPTLKLNSADMRTAALVAIALLGWRYFLSASQRSASR